MKIAFVGHLALNLPIQFISKSKEYAACQDRSYLSFKGLINGGLVNGWG